jgi:hypothetical protein
LACTKRIAYFSALLDCDPFQSLGCKIRVRCPQPEIQSLWREALTPTGGLRQEKGTDAKYRCCGDLASEWDSPLGITSCKLAAVSNPVRARDPKRSQDCEKANYDTTILGKSQLCVVYGHDREQEAYGQAGDNASRNQHANIQSGRLDRRSNDGLGTSQHKVFLGMVARLLGDLAHVPAAAAAMMVFLRPNLSAVQPEIRPPMAVPAV